MAGSIEHVVVALLGFHCWNVADGLQKTLVVEPIHLFECVQGIGQDNERQHALHSSNAAKKFNCPQFPNPSITYIYVISRDIGMLAKRKPPWQNCVCRELRKFRSVTCLYVTNGSEEDTVWKADIQGVAHCLKRPSTWSSRLGMGHESVSVCRAEEAMTLPENLWLEEKGPSYDRSMSACLACLAGEGPILAARANFCVAATAEMRSEVFEDRLDAMDHRPGAGSAGPEHILGDWRSASGSTRPCRERRRRCRRSTSPSRPCEPQWRRRRHRNGRRERPRHRIGQWYSG